MAKNAEYKIIINGLQESITQVDALNKGLDALEKKIGELEKKNVNINATTTTTSTQKVDNAPLQEQDKLTKDIWATQQKINDARDKDYQELVRLKDELKQAKVEAEGLTAASKLDENNYNLNTMEGIKEKLKDIKREMQTTDIGSDQFNKLTEEANELNTKLKDIEQSYGQFGRNVGNYASAAEGFDKLRIQVGDTTREFDNAREALKSLKNERDTLALMGKDFKEIDLVVKQLQSSIKDMSVSSAGMDNLLDTMQSIIAISSTAKGIGALFGMDDDKIEETIKKLVALQNVMQSIEVIQKQIQTQEGIGKWLATGSKAIDSFSTKMFGAKKAVEGTTTAMKTATTTSKAFSVALKGLGIGLLISLIVSLTQKWDKINDSINKSFPALEKFGGIIGAIEGAINGVINAMGNMIDILKALIRLDFSEIGNIISKSFSDGFQEVADEQKRIAAASAAEELQIQMDMLEAKYGNEIKYTAQYKKLLDERNKLLSQSYNPNTKEGKKQQKELEVQMEREKKERKDHAKEMAKLQREADAELTSLRISNMKDGLNKTLIQLEEERKARINKARETGRNVAEIELEINKEYDKKKEDAIVEFNNKQIELRRQLNARLLQLDAEQAKNEEEISTGIVKENERQLNKSYQNFYNKVYSTYGTGAQLSFVKTEDVANAVNLIRYIDESNTQIDKLTAEIDKTKNEYDALVSKVKETTQIVKDAEKEGRKEIEELFRAKALEYIEEADALKNKISELQEFREQIAQSQEALNKSLNLPDIAVNIAETGFFRKNIDYVFKERQKQLDVFYGQWNEATKRYEQGYLQIVIDNEKNILSKRKEALHAELRLEEEEREEQFRNDKEQLTKDIADEKEREDVIQKLLEQHLSAMEQLQKLYKQKEVGLEDEAINNIKKSREDYYNKQLQELRDYQTAINNMQNNTPVYNPFGVVDIKKTKAEYAEIENNLTIFINSIIAKKNELDQEFKKGFIDTEAYESTSRELTRLMNDANNSLNTVTDASRNIIGDFMQSIQVYTQAFSQTLSGILQAVWDTQDAAYERQKEDLERQTEVLEEQLDKQKEITEKYKDDVDSIEDELSTARGDRRQELIDQLNAEKAAQRASLAEEKRIEREKEKLQENAEKLDEEQRKKQKERDLITAGINASMAILGAAANHWPMPAIPLVAAATALGAAQIMAIKSKKYATGGVIEGPRHIRGGVKVLGGRAEVEGGEYITNRQTTMKNVELLEYINAKKKRIDLQDMVEFFDSGARRTIKSISPARKFAEGGELPMLNESLTINDRLLSAFERYAERPSVVSVVEIEDRMDDVNAVRALAGVD